MKKYIVLFSFFFLFLSCSQEKTYLYISYIEKKNGEVEQEKYRIEFVEKSDSAAIVNGYRIFFLELKKMYEDAILLGDTSLVSDRPAYFKILTPQLKDIRNNNFYNKEKVLFELYQDIVVSIKNKYNAKIVLIREKHLNEVRNSIKIKNYYLSSPNSVGGVSVYFYYKNLSDKPIKYLNWEGYPINAVNDKVFCTIRNRSNFRGRDTGPIKKGQTGGGYWDCAWYNWTAKRLILTAIEIEYMDGSILEIKEGDLFLIGKKDE